MRIYEMTATFGKLQHQVLTLKPGLTVVEAPNEWGKTTWCAFLNAMLYGLDTRARSSQNLLADKDHYAPWSGAPMSGRIDLSWQGRDITIERSTKGRIPLGKFRAYETATGLAVPELTGENCGEMLLGVEQSVFRRAGFLRLSDLPVTGDEDLRRRLNALVTTGDESGDGERLLKSLKELKNKCRYNKTGLIPQAEAEKEALEGKIEEQEQLLAQYRKTAERLGEVEAWKADLLNHRAHLEAEKAREADRRVEKARQALAGAEKNLSELEQLREKIPDREEAGRKLRQLEDFTDRWNAAMMEQQMLPEEPEPPQVPAVFSSLEPAGAMAMVQKDLARQRKLGSSMALLGLLGAVALLAAAGLLTALGHWPFAIPGFAAGLGLLIFTALREKGRKKELQALTEKYGTPDPGHWIALARDYARAAEAYQARRRDPDRGDLDIRIASLQKEYMSLCGGQTPGEVTQVWQEVLRFWESLDRAKRDREQAQRHLEDLEAVAKREPVPDTPDDLTYGPEDTARLLSDGEQELKLLGTRLGQLQGRLEAIGSGETLMEAHKKLIQRLQKLEEYYGAAELAIANLEAATLELQRRFAPRISGRAQKIMERLTGGDYRQVSLGEDFSLTSAAREEDVQHGVLWRSEGTADQLYLALRLAVAETLTPEAPLILDDALVRFDDERLLRALEILREESEERQVILFTCQHREAELLQSL